MLKEVPYDPHVPFLFFGEESSMSARLWTHGWDFFAPTEHIVYHLWSRDYRPTFREIPDKGALERRSQMRVHYLLGVVTKEEIQAKYKDEADVEECLKEIEVYGMGNYEGRTLEKFEEHTGVKFKPRRIVREDAYWGGLDKKYFVDAILERLGVPIQLTVTEEEKKDH